MILRDQKNCIDITCLEQVPANLPTQGDTHFSIQIHAEGFVSRGTAWVDYPALQRFARELAELDARRSGHAEMESMSPGKFRLTIKTTDGWGHVAACGRLENGKQAMDFEFEFQNDCLPQLVSDFNEFARPAK